MKINLISRKEKIVINTIDLINEIGIKNLSIKEIAKKENVTEASLYKHFKSKDEIIFEVLEYYSKFDANIFKTLKESKSDEKEKLVTYFKLFAEYYEGYPALTSIIGCYDILMYKRNLSEKIKKIIESRDRFIEELIEAGQKNNTINGNITSQNLKNILIGSFEKVIFDWRMSEYKFSLKEEISEITKYILEIK